MGPFASAADRYLAVLQRLFDAWRAAPSPENAASDEGDARAAALLLDLDWSVAAHCRARGLPEPEDIEERMSVHLAAIETWLDESSPNQPD